MSALSNVGRIGVFGASGSGKSSYVKALIKSRARVIVFDPMAEYDLPRVTSLQAVKQSVRARYNRFALAYTPPAAKEAFALDRLAILAKVIQSPYKAGINSALPMALVVEELNLSFPVHGGDARAPGFAELCSRGRHHGIELIGISQRVAEVGTRFRGNLSQVVIFRQQGPNDRRAAADLLDCPLADLPQENLVYLERRAGGELSGPHKLSHGPKKSKIPT